MTNKTLLLIIIVLSFSMATSCNRNDTLEPVMSNRTYDTNLGIETVPTSLGKAYVNNFDAYTKVATPNGGSIHIVAQTQVTNEQILRSRNILEHFLRDLPGSTYGADKSEVANKMAENNAILSLLNGRDDGGNDINVDGQYLFEEEIQVEGSAWYMSQNYEHRDAAYEEILHLVHDYGIGVDGPNANSGASPAFQTEIRAAQQNALSNNLWGISASDWITELANENSLSQEYLASVVDAYYGLWGAWKESSTHGMWGIYVGKTRSDMQTDDPTGYDLIDNKFFHPYLTYNARINASLSGNFSLKFEDSKPYTHHSRYLKDITLLGSNDITVTANELDNNITGNSGMNTIIFSGPSTDYDVVTNGGTTTVTDNTANRDGTNTLTMVEKLQFTDTTIIL